MMGRYTDLSTFTFTFKLRRDYDWSNMPMSVHRPHPHHSHRPSSSISITHSLFHSTLKRTFSSSHSRHRLLPPSGQLSCIRMRFV